ncbi:hypothetical protein CENSYa_0400 [Cenarchaeum symbiosum A]|uniref:Uncharacterized protein n=1 Tax=Cenarchaeum symbiosum (strain A) TaxID=414004 RepID=A0RUL9_CENSY|nr:hypothetical protein CENSYa_0400 [Cenarchaeum symbiosum A]
MPPGMSGAPRVHQLQVVCPCTAPGARRPGSTCAAPGCLHMRRSRLSAHAPLQVVCTCAAPGCLHMRRSRGPYTRQHVQPPYLYRTDCMCMLRREFGEAPQGRAVDVTGLYFSTAAAVCTAGPASRGIRRVLHE